MAAIPIHFSKLYLKLLVAQKAFAKAQAFLVGEGAPSFELWVERRSWQLRIHLESGQNELAIQEMLQMIRFNYTQVEEDFQSIYNIHEVVLSMALPLLPAIKDKTLSLEQFGALLQVDADLAEPAAGLFPDLSETDAFITNLNASFKHYANSFIGVKSVNALNCRKSALLSQMLLRHKVIVLSGLTLTKE